MTNISIDFLVTCVNKTEQEIISIIKKSNLKGNIIVGNQKADNENIITKKFQDFSIKIINQKTIGTSRNRNKILSYSTAEYVTFWDDDSIMRENWENELFSVLNCHRNENAIRFNNVSLNKKRKIKIIKKSGYVTYRKLRSFGVCGIFFKRQFLIDNNLFFNENIGPGTKINHGEDSLLLHEYLKICKKIYHSNIILFDIQQNDSCWFNDNPEEYFFSQGYNYHILYGNKAYVFGLYHIIKHINIGKNLSFFSKIRCFKKGVMISKQESKNDLHKQK